MSWNAACEVRVALSAALVSLGVWIAATVSAQGSAQASSQSAASPAPAQASAAPAAAPQESSDRLIAVARDVSPEWAASLEKVRERDPSGFERATGVLAKRLKALAVLKDRKPQLYALRVEELRIQGEVAALADQWRSAMSTGRTEEASGIETQLRAKVGTMVDLNLRSRAMELAELDEVMRSMRGDLERDARARDATVAEAIEAYRRGEEPAIGRSPVVVPASPPATGAADAASRPASTGAPVPPGAQSAPIEPGASGVVPPSQGAP